MPIDPPDGYLTRAEAARIYNRSQRALQRDLDAALRVGDSDVLAHYKLATKDGDVREAETVTIEHVKQLVDDGMTPVWCVEESWINEMFGRKGSPKPRPSRGQSSVQSDSPSQPAETKPAGPNPPPAADTDLLAIYGEQLRKQDEQIEYLKRELEIKNEQIREANTRTRESNTLMQELQKMLGSWQERAFQSLPAPNAPDAALAPITETRAASSKASQPPAAAAPKKPRRAPAKRSQKKTETPRKKPTGKSPSKTPAPKWYETPTLNKLFRR